MSHFDQPSAHGGYQVRPGKSLALATTPVVLLILVVGALMMLRSHHPDYALLTVWLAAGAAVIGFNFWAAFTQRGS